MKSLRPLIVTVVLVAASAACAQETTGSTPVSQRLQSPLPAPPEVLASPFDAMAAAADDILRAENGKLPLYARFIEVLADLSGDGEWTELHGGDRIWRIRLRSPGALGTELIFTRTHLPVGAQVHVYSEDAAQVHGGYTAAHVQPDGSLSTELILGDACVVEYHEPAAVRGEGSLRIERLLHAYRFADQLTGACNVDVNCSEGAGWQDQRDAVVRVRIVIPSGAGFCTGTLMNNTALDCKGYVLTAFHCTEDSQESNYPNYQFRFNYQRNVCASGSATGNGLTGCSRRAGSQDQGGIFGSDYTLLELTAAIPAGFNPYWAGWDVSTTAPANGIGIHHPTGDVKKISTFSSPASNATWAGNTNGSHWRVIWVATSNGHGVTEVGSSGSPLFNASKRVVGTLTGGSSCCTANGCGQGTGLTSPDFYGKMSFHFGSGNPNPSNERLAAWLSPVGAPSFLEGSRNPCAGIGIGELALQQFSIVPNPAAGSVAITLPLDRFGRSLLRVTDLAGRIVHEESMRSNAVVIDVAGWPAGLYQLTAGSDNGARAVGRLAIER